MSAVGNMDEFMKFKAAIALEGAANNPGGAAATGVGVGAGLGMGYILPQMLQQSISGSQAASSMSKEDPMEKIRKLKELLDIGAITKDEFESKKAILLKEI